MKLLYQSRSTYVVGAAIVLVVHLAFAYADYTIGQAFMAGVMGVLTFLVLLRAMRARRHELPILAWVVLQYYLYWAFPIFYEGKSLRLFPFSMLSNSGAMTASLQGDLLFVSTVVAGFVLVARVIPRRKSRATSPPISQPLLLSAAFASLALSFELIWYESSKQAFYYPALSVFSPTMLQLLMIFERSRHRTARWFDVGYVVFVVASVCVGLLSGRMERALYPIVVAALADLARTRRVPAGFFAAVVVMMVVMQPVKLAYRDLIGFRTNYYERLSIGESLDAMSRSFEKEWTGGSSESVAGDNLSFLGERLNERSSNAVVHYLVPRMVPYGRGVTLYPAAYALVPRILWSNKPSLNESVNNHFAVRLGFLTDVEARTTTKTVPISAEAFYNYGWPGIVGVGLICGLIFAVLFRAFRSGSRLFYVWPFYALIEMRPYDNLAMLVCDAFKPIAFVACWTLLFEGIVYFRRRRSAIAQENGEPGRMADRWTPTSPTPLPNRALPPHPREHELVDQPPAVRRLRAHVRPRRDPVHLP